MTLTDYAAVTDNSNNINSNYNNYNNSNNNNSFTTAAATTTNLNLKYNNNVSKCSLYVFTVIPPRLTDPRSFVTVLLVTREPEQTTLLF